MRVCGFMFGFNATELKILKVLAQNGKISVADGLKITKNIWRFNIAIKKLIEVGILTKTHSENNEIFYKLTAFGEDFCFILQFHKII